MSETPRVKEKLLFHVCCAPCSGLLSQALAARFDITVYFDNPNIWPEEEFLKRAAEAGKYFAASNVRFIQTVWDHDDWLRLARGLEHEPEKGRRCKLCYHHRLRHAADYAAAHGFGHFTTSLLISPWKDASALRHLGRALALERRIDFVDDDFQSDDGYGKSRRFAKENGFYSQKYCGCEYSIKSGIL